MNEKQNKILINLSKLGATIFLASTILLSTTSCSLDDGFGGPTSKVPSWLVGTWTNEGTDGVADIGVTTGQLEWELSEKLVLLKIVEEIMDTTPDGATITETKNIKIEFLGALRSDHISNFMETKNSDTEYTFTYTAGSKAYMRTFEKKDDKMESQVSQDGTTKPKLTYIKVIKEDKK